MHFKINIILCDKCSGYWRAFPFISNNYIRKILTIILNEHYFVKFKTLNQIELSILLTDNEYMQQLNYNFLSIDKPTNVLSFPDKVFDWKKLASFEKQEDNLYLGDLAFGHGIILEESIKQGKGVLSHFTHLLVHGILHFFGFDHKDNDDANVMEALEISILRQLNIPSPY